MDNILAYLLNTEELKIELVAMVLESGADLYLHTYYADPSVVDVGLEYTESRHPQPATTLAKIYGVGDV